MTHALDVRTQTAKKRGTRVSRIAWGACRQSLWPSATTTPGRPVASRPYETAGYSSKARAISGHSWSRRLATGRGLRMSDVNPNWGKWYRLPCEGCCDGHIDSDCPAHGLSAYQNAHTHCDCHRDNCAPSVDDDYAEQLSAMEAEQCRCTDTTTDNCPVAQHNPKLAAYMETVGWWIE